MTKNSDGESFLCNSIIHTTQANWLIQVINRKHQCIHFVDKRPQTKTFIQFHFDTNQVSDWHLQKFRSKQTLCSSFLFPPLTLAPFIHRLLIPLFLLFIINAFVINHPTFWQIEKSFALFCIWRSSDKQIYLPTLCSPHQQSPPTLDTIWVYKRQNNIGE